MRTRRDGNQDRFVEKTSSLLENARGLSCLTWTCLGGASAEKPLSCLIDPLSPSRIFSACTSWQVRTRLSFRPGQPEVDQWLKTVDVRTCMLSSQKLRTHWTLTASPQPWAEPWKPDTLNTRNPRSLIASSRLFHPPNSRYRYQTAQLSRHLIILRSRTPSSKIHDLPA